MIGVFSCKESCAIQLGQGYDDDGRWNDVLEVFGTQNFQQIDWSSYDWAAFSSDPSAIVAEDASAIEAASANRDHLIDILGCKTCNGVKLGDLQCGGSKCESGDEVTETDFKAMAAKRVDWATCPAFQESREKLTVNPQTRVTSSELSDSYWVELLGAACVSRCQTEIAEATGAKFSLQYSTAFYWSIVTLTTLGYGDITPASHSERGFCTVAMLIGASIFAYSVTNMCTLVHNLNPAEVFFRTRRDELNDYLEFLKTTKSLRQRVQDFYNFKVFRSDVVVYNQDLILTDMSLTMQEDVKYIILEELLLQVPFLKTEWTQNPKTFQEKENRRFLSTIATRLETAPMAPTEIIVNEGDIATSMHVIGRGVAACTKKVEGATERVQTLSDGSVFGAGSLFRPTKYGFTVVVEEYVDLYSLSKYDFAEVLDLFNKDLQYFENIAEAEALTEKDSNAKLEQKPAVFEEDVDSEIAFLRKQIKLQSTYIATLTSIPPGSLD